MKPTEVTNAGFQGFTRAPVALLQHFVGHKQVCRHALTSYSPQRIQSRGFLAAGKVRAVDSEAFPFIQNAYERRT